MSREARLNAQAGRWVGASVPRKEDRRMLLGRGQFVGDLTRAGMLHAAFVRSPFAAAGVTAIGTSAALATPGVAAAFTAADLGHPYLLATLERDEFVPTQMPLLAGDQVRFAGEPVAVVLADDAYPAEDAAELVEVDWRRARRGHRPRRRPGPGARQVHDGLAGNRLVDLPMFDDASCPASSPARRSWSTLCSAAPGWRRCRWRAAPAWPSGTTATGSWSCTSPPRCRIRCGPPWRRRSACRSAACG